MEITTSISRIGKSSFDVYQQCRQQGIKTVSGTATMEHFCHQRKSSVALSASLIDKLQGHFITPE
ncbi:MAG: hypothetical protein MJK13_11025 [Pseudomonadales bacterium]|nr:hypothetical protein [Pseudomonadales bacterium]